jgi:hypothetical protein
MRDRQANGNIGQLEVLEATCSSAQIPTGPIVVNNIGPEQGGINSPPYYPLPPPNINNIPQQLPSG